MLAIAVERTASRPMYRQIEDQILDAIRCGRLQPDDRLPSIRQLASQLDVARVTIAGAYDDLISEGYLYARVGSGTRVATELPDGFRASRLVESGLDAANVRSRDDLEIDVRPRGLSSDLFPGKLWGRLVQRAWADIAREGDLGPEWASGDPYLRDVVARYLGVNRGIQADASDVLVLTTTPAVCFVIARAFLQRGGSCAIEDPGCPEFTAAFLSREAQLVPVPVDQFGLIPEALPDRADMLLVSPTWAYPQGGVLPMDRRRDIVAWAQHSGALIVENEWAGNVRFHGGILPSIQTLGAAQLTIHVASFNQVIPATAVAFAVVPRHLRAQVDSNLLPTDAPPSAVEQRALAYFLDEGYFDTHLRRLKVALSERRRHVLEAVSSGDLFDPVSLGAAGMWLTLTLQSRAGVRASQLAAAALQHGLAVACLSDYRLGDGEREDALLIDYSFESSRALVRAVHLLERSWQDIVSPVAAGQRCPIPST